MNIMIIKILGILVSVNFFQNLSVYFYNKKNEICNQSIDHRWQRLFLIFPSKNGFHVKRTVRFNRLTTHQVQFSLLKNRGVVIKVHAIIDSQEEPNSVNTMGEVGCTIEHKKKYLTHFVPWGRAV